MAERCCFAKGKQICLGWPRYYAFIPFVRDEGATEAAAVYVCEEHKSSAEARGWNLTDLGEGPEA